jgi:hypothetical protein
MADAYHQVAYRADSPQLPIQPKLWRDPRDELDDLDAPDDRDELEEEFDEDELELRLKPPHPRVLLSVSMTE